MRITESEEYQLDRKATALKKAGDLQGAVAALRRRKALMGDLYEDTKLAKYLQEAGHFDEAMAEIQWLLDTSRKRLQEVSTSPNVSNSSRLASHAVWCGKCHQAAALICKRQGVPDLKAQHEASAAKYLSIWERLDSIGQQESDALRAQHRVNVVKAREAAIQNIRRNR